RALAPEATFEGLRDLMQIVRRQRVAAAPLLDENGQPSTLGEVILRRGQELKQAGQGQQPSIPQQGRSAAGWPVPASLRCSPGPAGWSWLWWTCWAARWSGTRSPGRRTRRAGRTPSSTRRGYWPATGRGCRIWAT